MGRADRGPSAGRRSAAGRVRAGRVGQGTAFNTGKEYQARPRRGSGEGRGEVCGPRPPKANGGGEQPLSYSPARLARPRPHASSGRGRRRCEWRARQRGLRQGGLEARRRCPAPVHTRKKQGVGCSAAGAARRCAAELQLCAPQESFVWWCTPGGAAAGKACGRYDCRTLPSLRCCSCAAATALACWATVKSSPTGSAPLLKGLTSGAANCCRSLLAVSGSGAALPLPPATAALPLAVGVSAAGLGSAKGETAGAPGPAKGDTCTGGASGTADALAELERTGAAEGAARCCGTPPDESGTVSERWSREGGRFGQREWQCRACSGAGSCRLCQLQASPQHGAAAQRRQRQHSVAAKPACTAPLPGAPRRQSQPASWG